MPSLVPGYEYDVFFSYSHDDVKEWTIAFKEQLESELRQALGAQKERRIWVDRDLRTGEIWSESIAEGLKKSASLLTLLSPNYFASMYCREEVDLFEQGRPEGLDNGSLFKVVRAPDLDREYETFHSRFQNAIFFDRDTEASLIPGTPDFTTQLHLLVKHIKFALVEKRNGCRKVFIAPPTRSCANAWSNFRAELSRQRFHVLAPLHSKADDPAASAALEPCSHSIHLLGPDWDRRNVDFLRLAASMGKAILVFIAGGVEPDREQRELVEALRRHEVPGSSVTAPTIFELSAGERDAIGEAVMYLARPPKTASERQDASKPGSVYLMCDVDGEDLGSGKLLARVIEAQTGRSVEMPSTGSPQERSNHHKDQMRWADAFVAFSDRSSPSWLNQKLRDIRYPSRFAREKPLRAAAVVVSDPLRMSGIDLTDVPLIQAGQPIERTSLSGFSQALQAQ